jgi:phosphatidylglycerophosphate synthase
MTIENAVLLIAHPRLMFDRVGGLSTLERQLWTLSRAGVRRVWISVQKPAERALDQQRFPASLELVWSQVDGAPPECPTPYVALSGDHFVRVETLRHVVSQKYPAPTNLIDPAGETVLQVVPFRPERLIANREQRLPAASSVYLESPVGRGPVVGWLLALGGKSQDGFMARHFDRHISLAVSRLLLDTGVTPNAMTLISSLIGLLGASFFLHPDHGPRLLGAALVWLHSVLDGCDGELARIRFQESALGRALDFWGDNLVHVALFSCLALGFYKADRNVIPIILGLSACVGTIGSAVLVYLQHKAPHPHDRGLEGSLSKLEDFLAARDFIYLLLILAYIDRLYEFMWATAVGSLLFFAMTLYLQRGNNEQARQFVA